MQLVAQRRGSRNRMASLGQEGDLPEREPGEESIRFDEELPGGSGDYVTAEQEMPEEIVWVQQMSGLPTIVRQNPRVMKIGVISLQTPRPAALITLGSIGMVASGVGGFFMIREALRVDYSLARIALLTGSLTAGLLFLHSALAFFAGLDQSQQAPS